MQIKLQRSPRPHEITGQEMRLVRHADDKYKIELGWLPIGAWASCPDGGTVLAQFKADNTLHAMRVLAEMGFMQAVKEMLPDAHLCKWCGSWEGASDQGDGWRRCNVCGGN